MREAEDEFFAIVRERFNALDLTRNAFAPFDFWPEGSKYLTLLAEVSVASLAVTARELARKLPGLREVDLTGLHLTVQELGFGNAPSSVAALADHFARVSAFECILGPLNAFPDAVFAEVRPFDGPRILRRAARDALPYLDTPDGSPERAPSDGGMAPHVTVGYFETGVPTADVMSALETTALASVPFLVAEVVLAAVERPTTECFRWTSLARFPLAR